MIEQLILTNAVTSTESVNVTGIIFEEGTKFSTSQTFPLLVPIDSIVNVPIEFDETTNTGNYSEELTVTTSNAGSFINTITATDTASGEAILIISLNGDMIEVA